MCGNQNTHTLPKCVLTKCCGCVCRKRKLECRSVARSLGSLGRWPVGAFDPSQHSRGSSFSPNSGTRTDSEEDLHQLGQRSAGKGETRRSAKLLGRCRDACPRPRSQLGPRVLTVCRDLQAARRMLGHFERQFRHSEFVLSSGQEFRDATGGGRAEPPAGPGAPEGGHRCGAPTAPPLLPL